MVWGALVGANVQQLAYLIGQVLLADTFTRVGGAIGNAETGGAWQTDANVDGSPIGVVSQTAQATGRPAMISLNSGQLNVTAQAALKSPNYTAVTVDLTIRGIDANNFLFAEPYNGAVTLYKCDAGVISLLASVAMTTTNGVTYLTTVACVGNLIVVSVDGVQKLSYTLAGADATKYSGVTATRCGLRTYGLSAAVFDNFLVVTA